MVKMDWKHTSQCTDKICYCIDPDDPDPICDCGRPGCCCICEELFEIGL